MGTRYLFKKAVILSRSLSPPDKNIVLDLCHTIRNSQESLMEAAADAMSFCLEQCRGLCCQNLDIDSVFSLQDFVFILMLQPGLQEDIQDLLDNHLFLILSPCPFLKNGKGPCIFPNGMKAQICAVTFCSNDENIKKFVRAVNFNFYKLFWLILFLRVKMMIQKPFGLFKN